MPAGGPSGRASVPSERCSVPQNPRVAAMAATSVSPGFAAGSIVEKRPSASTPSPALSDSGGSPATRTHTRPVVGSHAPSCSMASTSSVNRWAGGRGEKRARRPGGGGAAEGDESVTPRSRTSGSEVPSRSSRAANVPARDSMTRVTCHAAPVHTVAARIGTIHQRVHAQHAAMMPQTPLAAHHGQDTSTPATSPAARPTTKHATRPKTRARAPVGEDRRASLACASAAVESVARPTGGAYEDPSGMVERVSTVRSLV